MVCHSGFHWLCIPLHTKFKIPSLQASSQLIWYSVLLTTISFLFPSISVQDNALCPESATSPHTPQLTKLPFFLQILLLCHTVYPLISTLLTNNYPLFVRVGETLYLIASPVSHFISSHLSSVCITYSTPLFSNPCLLMKQIVPCVTKLMKLAFLWLRA